MNTNNKLHLWSVCTYDAHRQIQKDKQANNKQAIKIARTRKKKESQQIVLLWQLPPSLSGRILMVCPLFVNVPGCVSGCRLSITALLRGSAPYGRAYGTQHHQLMLLQLWFSTSAVCLPPVVSPILFISQGLPCFSFSPTWESSVNLIVLNLINAKLVSPFEVRLMTGEVEWRLLSDLRRCSKKEMSVCENVLSLSCMSEIQGIQFQVAVMERS